MNRGHVIAALLLAVAMIAGAATWLARAEAAALRAEILLLRDDLRELERLRGENQRLAASLPAAETLALLHADHAAVIRLRGEIETLKENLSTRQRALAEPVGGSAAAVRRD